MEDEIRQYLGVVYRNRGDSYFIITSFSKTFCLIKRTYVRGDNRIRLSWGFNFGGRIVTLDYKDCLCHVPLIKVNSVHRDKGKGKYIHLEALCSQDIPENILQLNPDFRFLNDEAILKYLIRWGYTNVKGIVDGLANGNYDDSIIKEPGRKLRGIKKDSGSCNLLDKIANYHDKGLPLVYMPREGELSILY